MFCEGFQERFGVFGFSRFLYAVQQGLKLSTRGLQEHFTTCKGSTKGGLYCNGAF